MKTPVDGRLLEEAARLRFRFACEDCAHFGAEEQRCSLGYQAAPRRAELDPTAVPPGPHGENGRVVELCKTFELA
jgi:hypothetical protein